MTDDRALDVQVAVQVMGWQIRGCGDRVSPKHEYIGDGLYVDNWERKGGHPRIVSPDGGVYFLCRCGYGACELPHYSSDISDAWQVKEAMNAKGYGCTIRDDTTSGGPVHVLFWQDIMDGETRKMYVQSRAVADCLPRAMCEAALQAVTQPLMKRVDE